MSKNSASGGNIVMQLYVVLSCKDHGGKKIYAYVCSMEESLGCPSVVSCMWSSPPVPPPPFLSCFGVYIVNLSMIAAVWQSHRWLNAVLHWKCHRSSQEVFLESLRISLYRGIYITEICWKVCIQEQLCTQCIYCMLLICPWRKTWCQRSFQFHLVHWTCPHMGFELVLSWLGVRRSNKMDS
jgi:hypothetical protein